MGTKTHSQIDRDRDRLEVGKENMGLDKVYERKRKDNYINLIGDKGHTMA